jgi:branched-chain amino acid transport system permease protein
MQLLLLQFLNGFQLSMLVFLLAVGLTLIFGLMNILNLAHGAFFTMGAYFGLIIAKVEYLYGSSFYSIATPDLLKGRIAFLGIEYPTYRLFIIAAGISVAAALSLVIDRTLIGATLRAGVDNREMVTALGININVLFALVFGFGSALAGFAGVVAAPVMSIYSNMGIGIVVTTFVVVVVGGLGNLKGSFYASLIVGMTDTFAQAFFPEAELFAIYALLIAVMIIRPQGLFGAVGRLA